MTRVLLQPRGTRRVGGQENFERSIVQGVPLARVTPHLPAGEAEALKAFGSPLRLWGSTPTTETGNDKARALAERAVGDMVFFFAEKAFIASAKIAYLLDAPALARSIWGEDAGGQTWEHIMVLESVEHRRRSSASMLNPLGRHEVLRSVTLLDGHESAMFLANWFSGLGVEMTPAPARSKTSAVKLADPDEPVSTTEAEELLRGLLGLPLVTVAGRINRVLTVGDSDVLVEREKSPEGEPVPIRDVQRAINRLRRTGSVRVATDELGYRSAFMGAVLTTLPGAVATRQPARINLEGSVTEAEGKNPYFAVLDGSAQVKIRKEQGALRRLLVGDVPVASCAICGEELPVGFLVAAHIKKRAVCTDSERNDLENVAMLACAFGCDALYEAGYISVDETGAIVRSEAAEPGSALHARTSALAGRACSAWTAASSQYFEWHRDTVYRNGRPNEL